MTSSFVLRLDTHAPVVTWGAVAGNVPGTTLVVPYTLDEPAILSARLIDFDSVVFPLTVEADRLTANLPDTVALGQATVEAEVEDDVGNATTRTLSFAVQASIIPPPPPPVTTTVGGGLPRETPPLSGRVRRIRAAVAVASGSTVRVGRVERSAVAASTRSRARSAVAISSAIAASSAQRSLATVEVQTTATSSTAKEIRRDDSQAALLALLL